MAKEINTQSVTFNPTAKTLNFSAWTSFDIRKLVAVINDTRNALIYSIANNGNGLASESGSLITLQFDTTSHNASDKLTIIYDDTQRVIIQSSTLPSGAATEAKQDTGNTSLSSINTKLPTLAAGKIPVDTALSQPLTDSQLRASAVPVSGTITANAGSGTFAVSASALPLPTNAATSALQTSGNTSLSSLDSKLPSKGQATSNNSLPVVLASDKNVSVLNSNPIFNDTFNSFNTTNNWNIISQASGDILQVDGNMIGSNYLVMSLDPLSEDTQTIIESKLNFNSVDKNLLINPSASQRVLGHEFSIVLVSTETPNPSFSQLSIASIQQTTTTLSVTTATSHNLQVGDRISISEVPDSRLNYTNIVVGTVSSPTSFTCTANAAGNLPSVSSSLFNTGFVDYRAPFDYIPNGVAVVYENASAVNYSAFLKNGGDSNSPTGTIGGNQSLSGTTIQSSQPVAGQYNNINFNSPINLSFILKEDLVQILDKAVDSATAGYTVRLSKDAIIPDPKLTYKVRLKIKSNKSVSRPIAKIISAIKSGTTTATITTDVAHGLTTNDFVAIYGISNQTAFPNLTSATAIASIVSPTQFTIIIGSASTTTSYGGFVARVNGGITNFGAISQVVQSIQRTSNVLTLVGNATWANLLVGDYVNLHGCRDISTGADLGLDGSYKVIYFTGTTLNLLPIGSAPTGADITTTNCGGAIIKRSDFRIHRIALREKVKNIVEIESGSGSLGISNSVPTIINNSALAVIGTTSHSSAVGGSPVRIGGKVMSTLDTTLVNNDVCDFPITSAGQSIQKPYGSSENDWQYTGTLNTTTAAAMTTAGAASIRNYLTALTYQNTSATATTIIILDGSTAIHTLQASATMAMPAIISFLTPLRGTAATALNINCGTTGASVLVNAQGYKSF
jgi:hypothetical protein